MRNSPLRHPLAILRTTIGLTQKEMGGLVDRAARTIQSIELGHLPLSEDLAMRLAHATGVDAGWLLEGNPDVPPRRGSFTIGMGVDPQGYTRETFEYYRAYVESPVASPEETQAAFQAAEQAERKGQQNVILPLPVVKAAALAMKQKSMEMLDPMLLHFLRCILEQTTTTPAGPLIRWKMRRFFMEVAKENAIDLTVPPTAKPPPPLVVDNPFRYLPRAGTSPPPRPKT